VREDDVVSRPAPSSPAASARLKRAPRSDTGPELALRRELHSRGLRYFVGRSPITASRRRRADIVFPRARVAVFVDGCFWHGCPEHMTWPKANAEWWRAKIEANVARDRRTDEQLREAGWTVVRVWEHEEIERAADRVELAVREAVRRISGGAPPAHAPRASR
jgi:DNA mismatch endonuclease (patch repair protein)